MISKKETEHIAKLSRLGLTKKEIEKFQKELSSILDYFEELKNIDVSRVKDESSLCDIETIAREDEQKSDHQISKKLLELAPETKNGYLKVKSIFNKITK